MHPNMGNWNFHSLLISKGLSSHMDTYYVTWIHNIMNTGVVSGADPTASTIPLEELYDFPGRDEGRRDGVYDVPSENGGVYSEVTKTEEPPPSPGEYAKFDNPLYDTT